MNPWKKKSEWCLFNRQALNDLKKIVCHVGYCPVIEFHYFESKCGAWGNFVRYINKNLSIL